MQLLPYDLPESDDRYVAPRKREPSAQLIGELIRLVAFPSHLDLPEGPFPLHPVARCVAEDNHPGDDAVGPQFMLRVALSGVNLHRLLKVARDAEGQLLVTPEIARACCELYDDDVRCLAACAFDDLPEPHSVDSLQLSPDNASLVLVCGVLIFDAERTRVGVARLFAPAATAAE
jgi:hypothetical protein